MQTIELKDNEMKEINGGTIGSSIINAVNDTLEFIYRLGYEFGSAIRRIISGGSCPLN